MKNKQKTLLYLLLAAITLLSFLSVLNLYILIEKPAFTSNLIFTLVQTQTLGALFIIVIALYLLRRTERERKLAEETLNEVERKLRLIVQNTTDVAIFAYDMNRRLIYVNPAVEKLTGYSVKELYEQNFIDWWHLDDKERIMKLWDGLFEGEGLFGEEFRLITKTGEMKWTLNSWGPLCDEEGFQIGVQGRISDITERKQAEEILRQNYETLHKAFEGVIKVLAKVVEMKDPYTAGHQYNVAELAKAIAIEMGLSKEQVESLTLAAIIHDLGKISVSSELLCKPGKITDTEFNIIKIHPQTGYEILKTVELPWQIAEIVLQHHERINGSGYPFGLTGDKIMLEAKILAVADVVEAMASYRPYRSELGIDKALEEISKYKGTLFDKKVVDVCVRLFKEKGFILPKYKNNSAEFKIDHKKDV